MKKNNTMQQLYISATLFSISKYKATDTNHTTSFFNGNFVIAAHPHRKSREPACPVGSL